MSSALQPPFRAAVEKLGRSGSGSSAGQRRLLGVIFVAQGGVEALTVLFVVAARHKVDRSDVMLAIGAAVLIGTGVAFLLRALRATVEQRRRVGTS